MVKGNLSVHKRAHFGETLQLGLDMIAMRFKHGAARRDGLCTSTAQFGVAHTIGLLHAGGIELRQEPDPAQHLRRIIAPSGLITRGRVNEADLLIKSQGIDGEAGLPGQSRDFHGRS